jgi:ABC-type branched-subunit amino acid transport system substrate-binding protein
MISRRLFTFAAGAAALTGFGGARADSVNKIILGQSAAFTGPAAQLGTQFHQGAQVWFDQVNASGGVGGRMIEIKKLDDGYEPDRCAANTRSLIDAGVFALFGYIGTQTCMAALPMVTAEHIPFIAPFTGASSLRDGKNRSVFHLRASYEDETALMVKHLTGLGMKRIAVFYQNDSFGKAGLEGVTTSLALQNLKPVAVATVERNSVDVKGAVKTILDAVPDAIVQVSVYNSSAAFIRMARYAGYRGALYNTSGVGTQALAEALGKTAAGVVVTQVVPSPFDLSLQVSREFNNAVKAAGNTSQVTFSSMEGYLAAKMFTEGLRRGGSVTREALVKGLESMGSQSFGGFNVNLSASNHVASRFVEISMLTGTGKIIT